MANFIIPYTTPANYTYDASKIEIDSGIAKLKDLTSIYETFYANYNSNINGNRGLGVLTGTAVGGASIVGGKLDLTGGSKSVNYAADLNADSQQVGTIRFKYTPDYVGYPTNPSPLFTIAKANGDADNMIMVRLLTSGKIQIIITDFGGSTIIDYQYASLWDSVQGTEYEFELNYDFNTGATRLFIDGVQWGATQTGTGTRDSNISFLNIGANYNNIQFIDGYIDDFQVFSTVQHTTDYTPTDPSTTLYSTDSPTIYKTAGDGIANIAEFIDFSETLGAGNEGLIRYQLSNDNINWLYWNGTIWTSAGVSDYNTVSECIANILNFDATASKIYLKVFLISDGSQKVEIDENQIGYVINTAPSVYAGLNKTSIYNTALKPFSDCLFSDLEDNIIKAEWRPRGGGFIEVPQGVYPTLLDAVRAFEYSPTHSGNENVYLKITDSYASSEDVLIVNVNKVSIEVNIKDINNNHLLNVDFTPGDSNLEQEQNSPFTIIYDIGLHIYTVIKNYFNNVSSSIEITIASTILNIEMTRETNLCDTKIYVDFPIKITKGDSFTVSCNVNRDLTDYIIRALVYDKYCNEIKLDTTNANEIDIINSSGEFVIFVDKDLTDCFDNMCNIELELENSDGKRYTIWKHEFNLQDEKLDWTSK